MLIPNKHNGYSGGIRRLYLDDGGDEGGGGAFVNLDYIGSETIVPGDVEYIRAPNDWNEVQQRIDYWENKVPNWKKTDSRYL